MISRYHLTVKQSTNLEMEGIAKVRDAVEARQGMVSEFFLLLKEALNDPVKSQGLTDFEHKLSTAGVIFLDDFLNMTRSVLSCYISTAPPVSPAWIGAIEKLGGFEFLSGAPPSAALASSSSGGKQVGKLGGKRLNKLSSPKRGTSCLGEWLLNEERLDEVKAYFSNIGLYYDLISSAKAYFFDCKPIPYTPMFMSLLTTSIVKVSPIVYIPHQSANFLSDECLQATASNWGTVNIDKMFAQEVIKGVRAARIDGAPSDMFVRFVNKDKALKSETVPIVDKFHAIKRTSRAPIQISVVQQLPYSPL